MNSFHSRYLLIKNKIHAVGALVQPYLAKLQVEDPAEEDLKDIPLSNPSAHEEPFPISSFSWKFWLIGGLVVLLAYGLHQISSVLYLIISGYIVAIALERFILFRESLGCKRGLAMGIAYFILVIFMLSGIIVLVPFIITQISKLFQIVLDSIETLQYMIETQWIVALISQLYLPHVIKQRLLANTANQGRVDLLQTNLTENIDQFISFGSSGLKSAGSFAVSLANSFFSILIKIVIVLTIAVFFSLEKIKVIRFIASLTKYPYQTAEKLETLYTKLGHRLEGQLLLSVIIGFLVALGLVTISLFGIDLPDKASLALIAWLTEFIPYIGPIIGGIPAVLVAVIAYWWKGLLIVVLLYWVIQQTENNIIVPALMSHKLGVNPLVIFLCMLLGASLFGFLGILFAVPIAVIVTVFFTHPRKKQQADAENISSVGKGQS